MKKVILFCLLVSTGSAFVQSVWQKIPESNIRSVGERQIVPSKYQTMQLNLDALQAVLTGVPR